MEKQTETIDNRIVSVDMLDGCWFTGNKIKPQKEAIYAAILPEYDVTHPYDTFSDDYAFSWF